MRSGPQYFNIRFHNQGMEIGYERVFITDHIAALACGLEEPGTGRFSPTRAPAPYPPFRAGAAPEGPKARRRVHRLEARSPESQKWAQGPGVNSRCADRGFCGVLAGLRGIDPRNVMR